MASNISPITGIRYGVVRLDSLKDWAIDEFNEVDGTVDYDNDDTILAGQRIYYVDRETVKMHLELFRLGGAYNVMVCVSEHVTKGNLCSPCVPNAVDLDSGAGDYEAYTLPPDWFEPAPPVVVRLGVQRM